MFWTGEVLGPRNRLSLFGEVGVGIFAEFHAIARRLQTFHGKGAAPQTKSRFDRFGQPLFSVLCASEPIDAHVDVVPEIFVERGWRLKGSFVAVHAPVEVALFHELTE